MTSRVSGLRGKGASPAAWRLSPLTGDRHLPTDTPQPARPQALAANTLEYEYTSSVEQYTRFYRPFYRLEA